MAKIKLEPTKRAFLHGEFTDLYGAKCSIQKSSLANEAALWLGVNDANPQVLARDAAAVGVQTSERNGWVPFPLPEGVCVFTRMHLSQELAAQLIPLLLSFVQTGELPEPKAKTKR